MKTAPMKHQVEALRRLAGRDYFALFMEQGTGKTWTLLADAERFYSQGRIDSILVIAPKGVHENWIRREVPEHLEVPHLARAYWSGMGKKKRAHVEEVFTPRDFGDVPPLRVAAIAYDALMTSDGYEFARRFVQATRAMIVLDESHKIKNPSAGRTGRVMKLRPHAEVARIATGTPITNAPLDAFQQMEFLARGVLGTSSYRSFVAEYAETLPLDHPMISRLVQRNPKAAHAQIVARNPDGSPRYRNLEKLQAKLAPHSYRVLKSECLDLPPKVYKQIFFDLTPQLARAYRTLEDDLRIELEGGEIVTVTALASLVKLQQITSGFVNIDGEPRLLPTRENPRFDALREIVEDIDGSFIVWARFRAEIEQVSAMLREMLGDEAIVEYHGGVGNEAREQAVDRFQRREARVFIGQAQSGGVGLTLTAAETVIYFSQDFNLATRLQSEDRAHRIGTKRSVVYFDLVALNTIDEPIARALQRKENVAAAILGDRGLDFRGRMGENASNVERKER